MKNKIINYFILFLTCLLLLGCKDKEGNNILIPDFIEFYNKKEDIKKVDSIKDEIKSTPIPLLKPSPVPSPKPLPLPIVKKEEVNKISEQERILINASKYVGEKETHGFNRSPFIDKINNFAGVSLGSPYCSSFVAYILYISDISAPETAWSPSMVSKNNIPFSKIKAADVFGLYFPSKKRIAHVGFVAGEQGNYIKTIEANTSPDAGDLDAKSREGDGIFKKLRNKKLMSDSRNKFSRYWK